MSAENSGGVTQAQMIASIYQSVQTMTTDIALMKQRQETMQREIGEIKGSLQKLPNQDRVKTKKLKPMKSPNSRMWTVAR